MIVSIAYPDRLFSRRMTDLTCGRLRVTGHNRPNPPRRRHNLTNGRRCLVPAPHRPLAESVALVHVDRDDASWAAQPFPLFSCRRPWAEPLLRRIWTHGFQVRTSVKMARKCHWAVPAPVVGCLDQSRASRARPVLHSYQRVASFLAAPCPVSA
jgi:hypothetical protein